jgi:1-acyl-sn-glycerol-3-phosphate acyltransferase
MRIRHKLSRQWRVCATGIAFITFIAGSGFFVLIAFPIIRVLLFSSETKRYAILQLIHWSFKMFMIYLRFLQLIEAFEVEGLEETSRYDNSIVIANHPTLIDVIAIMSCIPLCNCIVKKSLLRNICVGNVVRAAGYIVNDHAVQLVEECEESFKAGQPLIIFPEGSRSPAYGLHPFKRGAAQIALRTGVRIVLVVITCDPPHLLKGQPWYKVPERPLRFKLHFYPLPTFPKEIQEKNNLPLKVRSLTQFFEDFFRQRVHVNHDFGPN